MRAFTNSFRLPGALCITAPLSPDDTAEIATLDAELADTAVIVRRRPVEEIAASLQSDRQLRARVAVLQAEIDRRIRIGNAYPGTFGGNLASIRALNTLDPFFNEREDLQIALRWRENGRRATA